MTNTTGNNAPQPGWYPDPAGSPQLRWWDGTQWTQHLQPPAAPAAATQPGAQPAGTISAGAPGASYGGAQYQTANDQGYGSVPLVQPNLGPNPQIYTPFIWVIVLLPLLSAIALAAYNLGAYATPSGSLMMMTDPMYFVVSLLGWVIYGVSVWLAYLDWRALGRAGIVRPFHWAWAFLSAPVYVIGRTVVVRRRIGCGALLPIWILIAVYVITFIIAIVKVASLVATMVAVYGS